MFIVYWNGVAIAVFCDRDNADEYVREQLIPAHEVSVDFVEEDEDLFYSINSHA